MARPLNQAPALVWGVLSFVGPDADTESPFEIGAIREGTNFGNPTPIIETLPSLLIEGALSETTGYEPREVVIRLRVSANDGEALAAAEAALDQQRQLLPPPPLTWTSPVGLSEACVFEVTAAKLLHDTSDGWDLDEQERGFVYYELTLYCLPFVRPIDSVVVSALPLPADPDAPVVVQVDDCSTLTPVGTYAGAWSKETSGDTASGPTAGTYGGETVISSTAEITHPSQYLRNVRTFSTPLSVPTGHYLMVDMVMTWDANRTTPGVWKIHDGSAYRSPVLDLPSGGEAYSHRLFFEVSSPISTLKMLLDFDDTLAPLDYTLRVANIAYTDTLGYTASSTLRQQARSIEVGGTVPTQAALRVYVADDAEPLGDDVLVYASSNTDWQPPLTPWYDSGGTVATVASAVSGTVTVLDSTAKYLVPAQLLTPGAYALMARYTSNAAAGSLDLTWQARMVNYSGADTVGSSETIGGTVTLDDLGGLPNYAVTDVAALILPVLEVETNDYKIEFTFSNGGDGAIGLDEVWLYSLDDGSLTWIKDPDAIITYVDVRSPDLGAARPSVWAGYANRRVNVTNLMCESVTPHRWTPGPVLVHTVTTGTALSQCEMEYFPRFPWRVWAGQQITET